MSTETLLGIGALVVLVAFILLAFRKGFSVKPTDDPPGPSGYT